MLTKPQRYPNQVDWGDYKTMPDYREGWSNPHSSPVTDIHRALSPDTYAPGFLGELANGRLDVEQQRHETANQVLSPIVGFLQDGQDKVLPYHKQFHHWVGLDGIDRFIREKPADAAAIAAATYFTAGAAGSLADSGTAGATASADAGSTGLTASQTAQAANAITPAFESGSYSVAASSVPTAAEAAITPAFESSLLAPTTAAATPTSSWFSTAKNAFGKFNSVDSYRSNIQRFANNQGPTERERSNAQAAAIGDRILNAGNHAPDTTRSKIASQIVMNRWGMR